MKPNFMKPALILFLAIFTVQTVLGVSQEELSQAETLINANASCGTLTESQLEIIGEYYMEQMMPGQAHENAHQMMGLAEGSEEEEEFHIDLARRMYCGENTGRTWRMGMSGGMMSGGMMGFGWNGQQMMGGYGYNYGYTTLLIIAILAVLALVGFLAYFLGKKTRRQ